MQNVLQKRYNQALIASLNKKHILSKTLSRHTLFIKTGFRSWRGSEKHWRMNTGLSPDLARTLGEHCPLLRAVGVDFVLVLGYHNRGTGKIAHRKPAVVSTPGWLSRWHAHYKDC
jgi:kynurenine formamidase